MEAKGGGSSEIGRERKKGITCEVEGEQKKWDICCEVENERKKGIACDLEGNGNKGRRELLWDWKGKKEGDICYEVSKGWKKGWRGLS